MSPQVTGLLFFLGRLLLMSLSSTFGCFVCPAVSGVLSWVDVSGREELPGTSLVLSGPPGTGGVSEGPEGTWYGLFGVERGPGMGNDPAGAVYGAGGPQASGGTVPHGTGSAPDTGGRAVGCDPEDGYGTVGCCPPNPGAQSPEDIDPRGPKEPAAAGSVGAPYGLGSSGKCIFGVAYGPVGPGPRVAGAG